MSKDEQIEASGQNSDAKITSKGGGKAQSTLGKPTDRQSKARKSSGRFRGYGVILAVVVIVAIGGLGASLFALKRQQTYNMNLQALLERQLPPTSNNDQKLKPQLQQLQQGLMQTQSGLKEQKQNMTKLQQELDQKDSHLSAQVKAVNSTQAQTEQKISQIQNSYLQPSSQLVQQIQMMHKQAAVLNLQFAKDVWNILGAKAQTLYFLNQAQKALLQVDQAGIDISAINAIKTAVGNAPSLGDSLHKLLILQTDLRDLQLKKPLSDQTNSAKQATESINNKPLVQSSSDWQGMLKASWQELKDLVSVHQLSDAEKILNNQKSRIGIYVLLYLRLQQVQLALVNHSSHEFKQSKQQLLKDLQLYIENDQKSQKFKEQLQVLKLITDNQINERIDQVSKKILYSDTAGQVEVIKG